VARIDQTDRVLLVLNNIKYTVATPKDADAILECIATSFTSEPGCSLLGVTKQVLVTFTKYFIKECCLNGLSVIAHDVASGEIAGALISRDFFSELEEGLSSWVEKSTMNPIIAMLHQVDEMWLKQHPNKSVGHCVNLWMLGILDKFRGRKIANTLVELGIQLATEKLFKIAVVECSGSFSRAACEKVGMVSKCDNSKIRYFSLFHSINVLDILGIFQNSIAL